ncbi:MAG: dockerin type I domain-containing protein [Phycisphaerales bacterium]|nr:dockerin type I domain-containing protein [Phycisphaerales bacterium]
MPEFHVALIADVVEACPADWNNDGTVNTLDVLQFLNAWTAGDPAADLNGDTVINTLDVLAFLNIFAAGCD